LVDQAEDGNNNILISLGKIESEVMGLTHGSEYYKRKLIHKEGNAKSALIKKQENSLTSCANKSSSNNNQKHGNTVPQLANSVLVTNPGRIYYCHLTKFNHDLCPRRSRTDGHKEMDNTYLVL
jgi:hypothetical protein